MEIQKRSKVLFKGTVFHPCLETQQKKKQNLKSPLEGFHLVFVWVVAKQFYFSTSFLLR